MKDTYWQTRAREAGLTQKLIATLTARNENTVGRALNGARLKTETAGPYIAVILAWEIMSPDQRSLWIERTQEKRS